VAVADVAGTRGAGLPAGERGNVTAAAEALRRALADLPHYDPREWCAIDAELSARIEGLVDDIGRLTWRWVTATSVHDASTRGVEPPRFDIELLELASRVRHVHAARSNLPPPATAAELAATEELLGFNLPSPLQCMYLHVANGGFGPGIGGVVGAVGGGRRGRPIMGGVRNQDGSWQWRHGEFGEADIVDSYRKHLAWEIYVDPRAVWEALLDPALSVEDEIVPGDRRWFEPFHDRWPAGLLPLNDYGCGHSSQIDASSGRLYFMGPDLEGTFGDRPLEAVPLSEYLQPEAPSLTDWLETWLGGGANPWGYGKLGDNEGD
jgi:hypothetical protein